MPNPQPKTSHTQNAIRYRDDKRWVSDRRCLNVRFLNGSQEQRRLVKRIIIENYNSIPMVIRFVFLRPRDLGLADIRVRFADGEDSWSLQGTENKYALIGYKPTMTLNLSGGAEFHQNTILQTFGLALGLRLEHLHPDSGIVFDHAELRRQGVTERDIEMVWTVLGIDKRRTVPYDRNSIMHYPVEVEETTNLRQRIPHKNCLSKGDRAQLMEMYPAQPSTNGNNTTSWSTSNSRSDYSNEHAKAPKKNSEDVTVIKYGRKTVEVPNTYVDRKGRERKISPFTRMMKWMVT
ncbi:hypothetical protein PG991_011879 [Apiospora marii]|uniref:Uncharacterized protein n=1 Tax=Apiospora marii TaxID=335849 RepID=A0ABR1RFH2_9PEZI